MTIVWKKAVALSAILLGGYAVGFGQGSISRYELGIAAGVFIYQGDLTPSRFGSYKTPGGVVQLFAERRFHPALSLRAHLLFGTLRGDDAAYSHPSWRQQRNLNFSASVAEVATQGVYYFREKEKKWTPYLMTGAGLSFTRIRRDWSSFNSEYFSDEPGVLQGLADDIAHRPPRMLPVFPLGAGLRFRLSKNISLSAETSYRFTSGDYIDGFSKAANPQRYDHYQSHTIGLIYSPGKKSGWDCPVVRP